MTSAPPWPVLGQAMRQNQSLPAARCDRTTRCEKEFAHLVYQCCAGHMMDVQYSAVHVGTKGSCKGGKTVFYV